MKRLVLAIAVILVFGIANGQTVVTRLQEAFDRFSIDTQLRHASISIYIIDAASGEIILDKNSQLGMAPASTQKIITSVTAFELLGKDFRYSTQLSYGGQLKNGQLDGNIYIEGSGDPTLGSWRYAATKEELLLNTWVDAIMKKGIRKINGELVVVDHWDGQRIPDGWIWQDIGNYYGAGARAVNWRENQFDIVLASGSTVGDPVRIVKTIPEMFETKFRAELLTGPKGSGDNAYIYLPERNGERPVRGTIPAAENAFTISGSMTDPAAQLTGALKKKLVVSKVTTGSGSGLQHTVSTSASVPLFNLLLSHRSPTLDSIIYFFNKRSINLYGEALVKTMGFSKTGSATTDSGIAVVRKFWKEKGLDDQELNMYDGSGLSPLNRVTTHAQVTILKYAREQEWFPLFYAALPEFNNMKMKSGTISDTKGFCGYHTSRNGKAYIFSFLVNNYSGRATQLINKMYRVLDVLKE